MRQEDRKQAEDHVDWLISILVPIIRLIAIEEFIHGYKHGVEDRAIQRNTANDPEVGVE